MLSRNNANSNKNILLLGDSRFCYLDISNINYSCINMAVGGTTTYGIILRFNTIEENVDLRKINKIFINIGHNDAILNHTTEEYINNLKFIIYWLNDRTDSEIIIFNNIPDTKEKEKTNLLNLILNEYNKELNYLTSFKNTKVYNLYDIMTIDGYLNNYFADPDGIHYNEIGKEIIYEKINELTEK